MARMRILRIKSRPVWTPAPDRGRGPRAPARPRAARTGITAVAAILVTALALIVMVVTPPAARAASLIRDAEIERIIRTYAAPLLRNAGIPQSAVTIRLLNDDSLNAFVTTRQRMFIHTGLVMRTERVETLVGVIAHEIGHIAGGHLVRLDAEREQFTTTALLATLVSTAAGALAGRPDVGLAVGSMAQGSALRGFLAYTRTEESSADAFALSALEREGLPADGLHDFMRTLQNQEALSSAYQDPYLRTHPLTRDRLSAMEAHLERSRATSAGVPAAWREMHARMRAKLIAFLRPPSETLNRYKDLEGPAADYARAIAYYKAVDLDRAVPLIDALITAEPDNPFFEELKGQMLFESGRVAEALTHYQRAVALAPEEPLLRVALAHAQVESGDTALLKAAQDNLRNAVSRDADNALAWRLLALAYGRAGESALADYAMAETAVRSGEYDRALFHVGRAQSQVPRGSPTWLRLEDIDTEARRRRRDKD